MPYSQMDISQMMNHINSYKRKALFGKSAYDLAMSVLPYEFFILLGLEVIPAEKILLKSSLLKTVIVTAMGKFRVALTMTKDTKSAVQ